MNLDRHVRRDHDVDAAEDRADLDRQDGAVNSTSRRSSSTLANTADTFNESATTDPPRPLLN